MEISTLTSVLSKDGISDLLNDFFYSCISEICGCRGPIYQQFINIGWSEIEYNYMHTVTCAVFTNPTVLYLDKTKLPTEFLDFPDNIQIQMLNCVKEKQECLVNALVKKNPEKDIQTVIDFDWRLKMIMGSSQVGSLREPLLQLDLRVMENGSESILDLEMNKDELDCFINALESATL